MRYRSCDIGGEAVLDVDTLAVATLKVSSFLVDGNSPGRIHGWLARAVIGPWLTCDGVVQAAGLVEPRNRAGAHHPGSRSMTEGPSWASRWCCVDGPERPTTSSTPQRATLLDGCSSDRCRGCWCRSQRIHMLVHHHSSEKLLYLHLDRDLTRITLELHGPAATGSRHPVRPGLACGRQRRCRARVTAAMTSIPPSDPDVDEQGTMSMRCTTGPSVYWYGRSPCNCIHPVCPFLAPACMGSPSLDDAGRPRTRLHRSVSFPASAPSVMRCGAGSCGGRVRRPTIRCQIDPHNFIIIVVLARPLRSCFFNSFSSARAVLFGFSLLIVSCFVWSSARIFLVVLLTTVLCEIAWLAYKATPDQGCETISLNLVHSAAHSGNFS